MASTVIRNWDNNTWLSSNKYINLFNKYFNNISFNRFVKNITELMEFRILDDELKYLKTFFLKFDLLK